MHTTCQVLLLSILPLAIGCSSGSRKDRNAATSAPSSSNTGGGVTPPAPGGPAPELLGIRWPGAQAGELLRIRGANLPSGTNAVTVKFPGGVDVQGTAVNGQISLNVPAGATSGNVVLEVGGQTSNPLPFQMWGNNNNQANDDHGDDRRTASLMVVGAAMSGRIDYPRDADWFAFPMTRGDTVRVRSFDLQDAMETILYVVDPSGVDQALNFRLAGKGWASGLDYTATQSGTHYVRVEHKRWNADTGRYRIVVQPLTMPEPTNTVNVAPQILSVNALQGTQRDGVTVTFTVNDPDGDPLDLFLGWRVFSASATEFYPATIHSSSQPVRGLASGATGRTYTVTWDSRADAGAVSGRYELQLQAADGTIVGTIRSTQAFDLDNTGAAPGGGSGGSSGNQAPTVVSVGTPRGVQTGAITIPYRISDAEADSVTVEAYYMLDAAQGFLPATMHPTSDPVLNVTTTSGGVSYRFVWDSFSDLGQVQGQNVVFQIRVRDARSGVPRTTGNFVVTN